MQFVERRDVRPVQPHLGSSTHGSVKVEVPQPRVDHLDLLQVGLRKERSREPRVFQADHLQVRWDLIHCDVVQVEGLPAAVGGPLAGAGEHDGADVVQADARAHARVEQQLAGVHHQHRLELVDSFVHSDILGIEKVFY